MTQVTMLTGPERRRRWSHEEQRRIVAEAFSPGAMVTEVARRFAVSTSLIYKWRQTWAKGAWAPGVQSTSVKLPEGLPTADRFTPVVLVEETAPPPAVSEAPAIVIDLPGGGRVSIGTRASASVVAAALRALR